MVERIERHHAEWLSLIEISGPFLSISVLSDAMPQGLDVHNSQISQELRAAYDEWADNQRGLNPEQAMHTAWIDYVLKTTLELPDGVLAQGQVIPEILKFTSSEHGETIRPDWIVHKNDNPNDPRLLINVYEAGQDLERQIKGKRWSASPAQRMQELCHATDIPIGLVTNGDHWMLVNARRGETTGFITWDADLWTQEKLTLQAFRSLLGAYRFFAVPDEMLLSAMLERSADDQHEVTNQLGYQVRQAVEIIVQTIDRIDADRNRDLLLGVEEDTLYEVALTVMMRLVFLLSAEERDLLPMDNFIYNEHYAISTLRGQLREIADQNGEEILERRHDAWSRLLATFRAVHGGIRHENFLLPAYGGSLFDPDKYAFLEGRPVGSHWGDLMADPLPIDNRTVLHLLEALQLLRVNVGGAYETRRISFRALDIEQIGHVYEGLLDHKAARAEEVILGLRGAKNQEPEVALNALLELAFQDTDNTFSDLLDYLENETGRSRNALRNDIERKEIDGRDADRLMTACNGDEELFGNVKMFAHLIRSDDYGYPVVIHTGAVYVTSGTTRRATGTHYTPRSLTEPIVQHTLEPIVYIGPAEGHPREQWQLKKPQKLLDLKICDMAMGSGAFLVQVVRYMSERLIEAWDELIVAHPDVPSFTVEGLPPSDEQDEAKIPTDPDERLTTAKRLIADRCIYGVDKNPLAVEMAKLSLWLITLEKDRPFTFIDHALKAGDSLVGVDFKQLTYWNLDASGEALMKPTHTARLQNQVDRVRKLRREIASFPVRDIDDQKRKQALHAQAEAVTNDVRASADLLIATYFNDLNKGDQATLRGVALEAVQEGMDIPDEYMDYLQLDLTPFHWHLEYPEVFMGGRCGFDAFVGNPPFIGGKRISTVLGGNFEKYLKLALTSKKGAADLCTYFFLKGFTMIQEKGNLGLIATNTISQTETREIGLDYILSKNGEIYRTVANNIWPGTAGVTVSIVHIHKGYWNGIFTLDNKLVNHITAYLTDYEELPEPYSILHTKKEYYGTKGIYVYGTGFVLNKDEYKKFIQSDNRNQERIQYYMTARDLTQNFDQIPSRWAINFGNESQHEAQSYPQLFNHLEQTVKIQREKQKKQVHETSFWKFWDRREELQEKIYLKKSVIVCPEVSKFNVFALVSTNYVLSHMLNVIARDDFATFSCLQSCFHNIWTWNYASTLESRLRYSTSKCLDTFPFPDDIDSLEDIGERYHETRKEIMLANDEGLTKTYNRFHDPEESASEIIELRSLHVEMDEAVAIAYGWSDIELGHDFHETQQGIRYTISESARREVLTRLLKLNHERYQQEALEGLHGKKVQNEAMQKAKQGQASMAEKLIQAQKDEYRRKQDRYEQEGDGAQQKPLFDDNNPKQGKLFDD